MKTFNTIFKRTFLPLVLISNFVFSQTEIPEQTVTDLKKITISEGISLHIISPEPIQFVDLSTNNIIGDLPAENIARIKIADSAQSKNLGIITVVCASFMAQYKLNYQNYDRHAVTNIQIQPEDMQPLDYPKIDFSKLELQKFSFDILKNKKPENPIRKEEDFKLKMMLNNVYVVNDYIFLDMSFQNFTNISYSMDGIKFSIEDKKIYKATNNQSIEIEPIFKLNHQKDFRRNFRNIYVFRKFTYPNSKVLKIKMFEEPISGRTVEMKIKYKDILKADTF